MKQRKSQEVSSVLQRRRRRERRELIFTVVAFSLLLGAWLFGYFQEGADIEDSFIKIMPDAERFVRSGDLWKAYAANEPDSTLVGCISRGSAISYGGPLEVIAALDLQGQVIGVMVVDHRDTPSFIHNVAVGGFLDQLPGKSYRDPFQSEEDIDVVTGATITSEAIARSVQEAAIRVAKEELSKNVTLPRKKVRFGLPEVTLILLYAVGFIAHRPNFPKKNIIRWATMIIGLLVLGFWFNRPLTVAHITSLLAGYFPSLYDNLYWYLLVGGIFLIVTVDNRNPYCSWFCPFGAFQECLSAVGNTRWNPPRKWRFRLKWATRVLAFGAIFFGLLFRQPSATSYEIFGTLFNFTGSIFQWILLVLIILSSLVIYRPWCTYLCPLDPVVDVISTARKWIIDLWPKKGT